MLVSSAVELLYQISPANVQCRPVKILLALMTVLIGPLSLITLQVSINNIIVNIRTREGDITTNGLHKERVALYVSIQSQFWGRMSVSHNFQSFKQ